jgi:hypothetical protein
MEGHWGWHWLGPTCMTKLLKQTIEEVVVDRPKPSQKQPQHLCLDKA